MTDDPVLRVERELGLFLRRARAASAGLARTVHPDLDASAYLLLAAVARTPGTRASDLADLLGVGRGTMSRQVTRLERLGLLTRSADPRDSRSQPLTLTEEGARRLAHARTGRQQYLRDSLVAWPAEELTHLADLLARLNDDLVQDGERSAGPG
ncbi:MarR family winged helix-turn-helix transcriptional regulator [Cellulomonas dongxiuzhuiae]|uniref:MarR family transcriptional regulator n=1 Tax=Cellulomonas dongxiuzhuiae TaxID=2819979 RepID=A0ABX8GGZ2_9CELL|nr:MarR family transcriptional regulator [Cellulomonas dongxiuzhuiae]MBO3088304.1 MarR family transcriptional regulator [Cellulomonas dongxiuzhuiae]MBO3094364.1 MarR family transcriptional regulator [Cellulomonas dongxiuzhuiae]QWC15399.1 MarR family transcriptional regulator [Cellulomonas dongxiuzhuiae]